MITNETVLKDRVIRVGGRNKLRELLQNIKVEPVARLATSQIMISFLFWIILSKSHVFRIIG